MRCRYCGEAGHNVRTCPKVKTDAADPNNYRQYRAESLLRRRETISPHKCKYCGTAGHTVRTCPSKKTDHAEAISLTAAWRRKLLEHCASVGLAPGALIKDGATGKLYCVTGFSPQNIGYDLYHSFGLCAREMGTTNNQYLGFPESAGFVPFFSCGNHNFLSIVCQIDNTTIESLCALFSTGWLAAADCDEKRNRYEAQYYINGIKDRLNRLSAIFVDN